MPRPRRFREYHFGVFLAFFIGSFITPLDAADDCCCWHYFPCVIMGYEHYMCWDNGVPDPDCGFCTLDFGGTTWLFGCRQDSSCEEWEVGCDGWVLIREVVYGDHYDCEFCFCDPPPSIPISGRTYMICNEENCATVSTNCNCD